jgi:hypothetical protein
MTDGTLPVVIEVDHLALVQPYAPPPAVHASTLRALGDELSHAVGVGEEDLVLARAGDNGAILAAVVLSIQTGVTAGFYWLAEGLVSTSTIPSSGQVVSIASSRDDGEIAALERIVTRAGAAYAAAIVGLASSA